MQTLSGDHWTLPIGDNRASMAAMPEGWFHAVVTSPPYWGLRDYGVAGQLGSEPTIEEYLAGQLEVFRAVRRVLRDDGICWVNLGDTYSAGTTAARRPSKNHGGDGYGKHGYWTNPNIAKRVNDPSLDPGNQMLMPHRFAMAMQADGWILRSTVIWSKPSPMPESVNGWHWRRCQIKTGEREQAPQGGLSSWDMGEHAHGPSGAYRGQEKTVPIYAPCEGCGKCAATGGFVLRRSGWRPTTSHEYVFQFVKSQRYYGDSARAQEPTTGNAHSRGNGVNPKTVDGVVGVVRQNGSFSAAVNQLVETRNPRSVWTISSEALKAAHFAAFPSMLVHKCLLPSISAGGCCAECGSQYAPVVEKVRVPTRPGIDTKCFEHSDGDVRTSERNGWNRPNVIGNRDPQRHTTATRVLEYRPTCGCNAEKSRPRVLDPYAGSGTTGRVAIYLGADFVGCELSETYAKDIAEPRLNEPWVPKHKRPKSAKKKRRESRSQRLLW